MDLPLENLRLLDLSDGLPGAYCAKLLVDAGADAIKVEPRSGDPLRTWWCSGQGDSPPATGALYKWLQASKRSVVADLSTGAGRSTVAELAAEADIVLESFPVGMIEKMGLGHEDLLRRQPQAVLVSISDFGRGLSSPPPPASELTLQARAGSVHPRGDPDRFPVAAGGRLGMWAAGLYAAVGALAAWRRATQSGVGEHVDVSRLESMVVTLMGYAAMMRSIAGDAHVPYTRSLEIPSVQRASDGWIGFSVVTNAQWQAFAIMIGQIELAEGDWALASYRQTHRAEVEPLIEAYTSQHTVADLLEESAKFRIPAAPIVSGDRIPFIEPLKSLGMYVQSPDGDFLAPRPPYQFSACGLRPFGRAPELGEHNSSTWIDGGRTKKHHDVVKLGSFAGIRILDLTAFWAGPYATGLFAGLGADVIKVESVGRPDPIRYSSSVSPSDPYWFEKSAVFGSCNANKRGITLSLDTPAGRDLALRLVERSDVVIENFTPRVMEKFGLDYQTISSINPRVVMLRMSAFGAHGPWRDRPGFAQTMEQISGLGWITGYSDARPILPKGACDPIGGMHAALAVMMALEYRDRTGRGQLIEMSLLETAVNVAAEIVIESSAYGRILTRDGNHGPEGSPQGVYRCLGPDSWVAISVLDDEQWRKLVAVLGTPDWAVSPAFERVGGRRTHEDKIDAQLSAWVATQDAAAVADQLIRAGVPAAVAVPADHVLEEVPELRERGFWIPIAHPVAGTHDAPGWPIRFMRGYQWPGRPAPTLGEHNYQVLSRDLGLSDGQINELEQQGVIGHLIKGM